MKTTSLIAALFAVLLFTGFSSQRGVPKVKRLTLWKGWADTIKYHDDPKWIVAQSEFYPNGELKRKLSLAYKGDTLGLSIYQLNRDSTLQREIWYNKYLKKWMDGSRYSYHKGQKHPYMAKERFNYTSYYNYDDKGREITHRIMNERKEPIYEYESEYDSAGLLIRYSMFRFFDGKRDDERREIYVYTKNAAGQIKQKDAFYVAAQEPGPTVKTDSHGMQKITYHVAAASEKSLFRTEYYNDRNELIKTVEYDLEGKPQFIWTYDYEHYQ